MKSIQVTRYGGPEVLVYADIPTPTVQSDEVLVKVHASSINSADKRIMSANPWFIRLIFGWRKPKIKGLGTDFSGEIAEIGSDVTQWKKGDLVFGDMSNLKFGALAEYVAVPAASIAKKPEKLSHEEAASLPLASRTALEALRDFGSLKEGQHVLIVGASGGVGNSAIQIAKAYGAVVTAVCSSKNTQRARELGADHVLDYTRESFTDNDVSYDLILGVNAYDKPCTYGEHLKSGGKFVFIGGGMPTMYRTMLFKKFIARKYRISIAIVQLKNEVEDLTVLGEMANSGALKPVLEVVAPFDQCIEKMKEGESRSAWGKWVFTN